MRREPSSEVPIRLAEGWLWSCERPGAGMSIHCDRGALWVTQAGDARDVVLTPGESFAPAPAGKLVVQALAAGSVVRVCRPRVVQPFLDDATLPGRTEHRVEGSLRRA